MMSLPRDISFPPTTTSPFDDIAIVPSDMSCAASGAAKATTDSATISFTFWNIAWISVSDGACDPQRSVRAVGHAHSRDLRLIRALRAIGSVAHERKCLAVSRHPLDTRPASTLDRKSVERAIEPADHQ